MFFFWNIGVWGNALKDSLVHVFFVWQVARSVKPERSIMMDDGEGWDVSMGKGSFFLLLLFARTFHMFLLVSET